MRRQIEGTPQCHWAYTLQDLYKLSNVSLNVTRSDSLKWFLGWNKKKYFNKLAEFSASRIGSCLSYVYLADNLRYAIHLFVHLFRSGSFYRSAEKRECSLLQLLLQAQIKSWNFIYLSIALQKFWWTVEWVV